MTNEIQASLYEKSSTWTYINTDMARKLLKGNLASNTKKSKWLLLGLATNIISII